MKLKALELVSILILTLFILGMTYKQMWDAVNYYSPEPNLGVLSPQAAELINISQRNLLFLGGSILLISVVVTFIGRKK